MTRSVKGRSYDNTARAEASRLRRRQVLSSARTLFVGRGYVQTTMAAIAEHAGVSLDTVYELVGPKPELFRLLIETAISGRDEAVPADERAYVQQIQAEPTAAGKLRIYAQALPAIHARLAPLVTVLEGAASADTRLTELWREISERRAQNMRRLAEELHATGDLRTSVEDAADIIWATNSPELYTLLVIHRSWPPSKYSQWLEDAWQQLILHRDEDRR